MRKYAAAIIVFYIMFAWAGCKEDTTRFFPIMPSAGDTVALAGLYSRERPDSAWKSVFLDFSKEVQTGVLRSSWDLGFYCANDTFRVIINSSLGAAAAQTDKINLNNITETDTALLATSKKLVLTIDTGNATTVDPVQADKAAYLSGTVIKEISANSSANNVYIIKRGANTNLRFSKWIKVKINRTNNGYTVTYGNMNDNNNLYTTLTVTKDASYNWRYVSFSSRTSSYEPAKTSWDICWGSNTYVAMNADGTLITNPSGTVRAQQQPDFVLINFMAGVTAYEVIPGNDVTKIYDNFTEADALAIPQASWSAKRDAIGAKWRRLTTLDAGGSLDINIDRFYLVKDAKGNIYSVSFAGGGSRGNQIVRYKRLHDAETTIN
ncbi:HmuY family protein [Pedobacter hartonius]|uniref:HmuY protein n=1 Tax=Pedobacter hartonius TaxID=425514 RepID=A0A1H4E729_9SPHI|nr:HmuY family protein [Pedobacter hartonius]SEA80152.1 HmuY protein [Pedobacter hartonius]